MQLISQLPMMVKAVYVDGWNIAKQCSRVRYVNEFIERVKEADGRAGSEDFTSEEQALTAVKAVFRVIKNHVSEGEIEDLRRTLPEGIKVLLD